MSQSSVIGPGTTVQGNVTGEGSLEILGRVEGSVTMTGDVILGGSAQVLGDVSGATVSVRGAVKGDLRGTHAVLLESGARVVGDLNAPRIGIASGALVRGTVRTEGEAALAAGKRSLGAVVKPAFVAKPVAKVEPRLSVALPPPRESGSSDDAEDSRDGQGEEEILAAPSRDQQAERRPPPPVLPSLGKGARAKKKKGRDE